MRREIIIKKEHQRTLDEIYGREATEKIVPRLNILQKTLVELSKIHREQLKQIDTEGILTIENIKWAIKCRIENQQDMDRVNHISDKLIDLVNQLKIYPGDFTKFSSACMFLAGILLEKSTQAFLKTEKLPHS